MKGAFFLGNREFEVRDMEKRPLAADEVRIRVMACGVCGTDVHIYHGEAGSAEVTPPVVLGHEYAGIVEEVGADVKGLVPGDHVAVDPNIYCGACTPCRDGKKQFCEHLQALGVTRDGGFAQYSAAPAAQCFKLAPELPFEAGAMAEPLACGSWPAFPARRRSFSVSRWNCAAAPGCPLERIWLSTRSGRTCPPVCGRLRAKAARMW